jgi:hypothetical protein
VARGEQPSGTEDAQKVFYRKGRPIAAPDRTRKEGIMKILSPKIHAILDVAVILVLFIAPSLFDFANEAATVSYALGAAYILLVVLTAYPFGLAKVIPFTVHGTIELVLSPLLVAMPWIAGFADDRGGRAFYIAAGIALFIVWAVTDYKAADLAYGKHGLDVKGGRPRPA